MVWYLRASTIALGTLQGGRLSLGPPANLVMFDVVFSENINKKNTSYGLL